MTELWYPAAIRDPAPLWKMYPEGNTAEGVIMHSMEGWWTVARSMLMGADEVSWHYSIPKDGRVIAHFPLSASCWHAGGATNNRRYIGVEHEGVSGEPLTTAQVDASVALARWLMSVCGWPDLARRVRLFEHREVNASTTCPNGRIPWERFTVADDRFVAEDALTLYRFTYGGTGVAPGVTITPQPRSPQGNRVFKVEMP